MAAPPNNLFADAQIIGTSSGAVTGTTFDATTEGSEPAYVAANDQSVWYKWTSPGDGWYKFTIPRAGHLYRGTYLYDNSHIVLALLPDGTLTQMTQANGLTDVRGDLREDTDGFDLVAAQYITSGTVIYLRVSSYRDGAPLNIRVCDFSLLWEQFTPPANDDFANATIINSVPTTIAAENTLDATFQTGTEVKNNPIAGWDREQSLWYKFTAPATGRYRIAIPAASVTRTGHGTAYSGIIYLQISTGTTLATYQAGELKEDAIASDNELSVEAVCYVDLTASTIYYIRVSNYYGNKQASGPAFNYQSCEFDLEVTAIAPPANDNYANATTLTTTLPASLLNESTKDATEEATEPTLPYTEDQSIWYKFTPAVTGKYRFRIPRSSLVYKGHNLVQQGEVAMSVCPAAGVANHSYANALPNASYDYTLIDESWQNSHNAVRVVDLTAATEYRLKVSSGSGSINFNAQVAEFDLYWERILAPSNDDFANATAITGASGTSDFTALGSTVEGSEPRNFYWNGAPVNQDKGTVWFSWTAPSSGWFKFTVESLEESLAGHDIAIYTGAAIGSLTRINNAWAGTDPNAVSPKQSRAAIGINAVSGTVYKIQITGWSHEDGDAARLSWATLATPTGDTAATAVVGVFTETRIDNYGNTDNDLPPNATTLLSGHDEWWYNTGLTGKSKWFKYTAVDDVSIQIKLIQWSNENENANSPADIGLIAYKGANYGSLVVAEAYNSEADEMEDVACLVDTSSVYWEGDYYYNHASTAHPTDANPLPVVDVAVGETLWICVFGLYDDDINGDATVDGLPVDAAEFNADLTFNFVKPPNDDITDYAYNSVYANPTYQYDLTKSHWGAYLTYNDHLAGQIEATTYGATTQVGEPAHAGYGPTYSVWFVGELSRAGDWKFWVESTHDCLISIYEYDASPDVAALTLIDEDDDSGTGNWPEVVFNTPGFKQLWVCVDSKTQGNFTLKWEWVNPGPAPANDNFANATVVTMPGIISGTTIGAGGEYFEWDSEGLGVGVTDTVWYKFTATATKRIKIEGRVLTDNYDNYCWFEAYTGPDKDNLTRVGDPDYGGGLFLGPYSLNSQNDPLFIDVVNGTDYWIRVYTEEGHSEDFELWIDTDSIFLDLQPGGTEDQTNTDFGIIPIKFTPSGSEFKTSPYIDAATVPLRFTVSGFDDMPNTDSGTIYLDLIPGGSEGIFYEPTDAATVYLDLQPSGLESLIHTCFSGEGNVDVRWETANIYSRFEGEPVPRWFAHIHKGAQYC